MKGVNSSLLVATTALFSTGIAEKAHMAAHLAMKTVNALCEPELITSSFMGMDDC